MLRRLALAPPLVALALWSAPAVAAETQLVLAGEAPSGAPDHFFLEFEVPVGTLEIQIAHANLNADNILDWGLEDPAGFRGWGGGNSEDVIVHATAASRSYLSGPIAPGTWRVVVGKAKLVSQPALYEVTVTLRDATTLAPQLERAPYAPADLGGPARWYAGDFHVHSRESGDAQPTLDAIAEFARARGLDFAMIADHNTTSHLDYFAAAQSRHPAFLFMPGLEFTTYDGHANAIGLSAWVDHKIGLPGVTITGAAQQIRDAGALFSINHPALDIGDLCIGCAWKQDLPAAQIDAVEIATTGLDQAGKLYTSQAIKLWDQLCAQGLHIAALGGSDDHKAGVDLGFLQSPIGDPTTLVHADGLRTDAILAGIRAGRTVVKLQGPGDPMIELGADAPLAGDTITADEVVLRAVITGALPDSTVRFVHDGGPLAAVPVDADPFEHSVAALAPAQGEARWRAEVLVDGKLRTITSHLWLRGDPIGSGTTDGPAPTGGPTSTGPEPDDTSTGAGTGTESATSGPGQGSGASGCSCASTSNAPNSAGLLGLAGLGLLALRRPRPR